MSLLDNFPYFTRLFASSQENFTNEFVNYQPEISRDGQKLDGGFFAAPLTITVTTADVEKFRGWPDLYTEHLRVRKTINGKLSAHQLWQNKYTNSPPSLQLRNTLSNDANVYEEKTFPIAWLKGIYQIAQSLLGRPSINILDIDLRWGERFLTICGLGGQYLGFFPETNNITVALSMKQTCPSALIFGENFLQNQLPTVIDFVFINNDLLIDQPIEELFRKIYETMQDGAYLAIQTDRREFLPNYSGHNFHSLGAIKLREKMLDKVDRELTVWWYVKSPQALGKIFNLTIPSADKKSVLMSLYRQIGQLRWTSTADNPCLGEKLSYNSNFVAGENVARLWGSKDYIELLFRNGWAETYNKVRDFLFPLDTRGSDIYVNRAGDKLEEILDAAGIQPLGAINFLDLAGAPGAFSQVLLAKNPETRGWGMSLRGDITWAKRLENSRDKRFKIIWGPHGSNSNGDLLARENVNYLQRILAKEDINYVVADGAIVIDGEENLQEYTTFPLIVAESYTALTTLGQDGHFICKFFDMFNENTVGLVYILALCFQELLIVKPAHSRTVNSEKYLVGKKFQLFDKRLDFLFTTLEGIYIYASQGNQSRSIVPITYEKFVNMVSKMNTYLLRQQINSIQSLAAVIQTVYAPQFSQDIHIRECQIDMDRVRIDTYRGMF